MVRAGSRAALTCGPHFMFEQEPTMFAATIEENIRWVLRMFGAPVACYAVTER